MMARIEGWEERLAALLEDARDAPYVLGHHDCLKLACNAVQVITGKDYWQAFRGRYSTKAEALKLISKTANDFAGAVSAVTGLESRLPLLARRGDIMLYRDDAGDHLAVCNGVWAAVLGEDGLRWRAVTDPSFRCCWHIG